MAEDQSNQDPVLVANSSFVQEGRLPPDVDVVILPGMGGGRREGSAFAGSADTVYQALTDRGIRVAFAGGDPRQVLLFKSADWWGPVLYFGGGAVSGAIGTAIYDVIKTLVMRAASQRGADMRPHLDIQRTRERAADGTEVETETIHLGGDMDVDAFLSSLRIALDLPEEDTAE